MSCSLSTVSQYWCCCLVGYWCWWLSFEFIFFTAHFISVLQLDSHYCQALLSNIQKLVLNLDGGILAWFYLRKLSCGCGRGEGVGHHGAEYIQVIVVLACARATIVSWCSCGCVCDRKVKKLVLQVENKLTHLEKKQHCETILTELSITLRQFPNDILPENLWKIINKILIQYVIAVKSGVKQTELVFANVRICVVFVFI